MSALGSGRACPATVIAFCPSWAAGGGGGMGGSQSGGAGGGGVGKWAPVSRAETVANLANLRNLFFLRWNFRIMIHEELNWCKVEMTQPGEAEQSVQGWPQHSKPQSSLLMGLAPREYNAQSGCKNTHIGGPSLRCTLSFNHPSVYELFFNRPAAAELFGICRL